MTVFDRKDFNVFDITGFGDRMHAIRRRLQPRLADIGESLAADIASLVDRPVHAHVAKHARRTVNAPDDTWVAFGADKRGYKKDVHFKVAISRGAVRLLFEVGPEYYDKAGWVRSWNTEFGVLEDTLRSGTGMGWYRDEHDELPAGLLDTLGRDDLAGLARGLARKRDGQLVIGRRLEAGKVVSMKESVFRRAAVDAFRSLAPLFTLHEQRVVSRVS